MHNVQKYTRGWHTLRKKVSEFLFFTSSFSSPKVLNPMTASPFTMDARSAESQA